MATEPVSLHLPLPRPSTDHYNCFLDEAGNGGFSGSGNAFGGQGSIFGGNGGFAISGNSGNANGGSVINEGGNIFNGADSSESFALLTL